ncbi:MAG TPA: hypothetical protein PLB04_04870, partial [Nitrospira sp.]|nr:hypothetical protein [Nitrospira sp.]
FSIVTYTGTGANATVGHGLGVAPKLVIVKQRNGSTYSWTVHHDALSAGQVLFLEATSAATARATSFNSTDPSSTVFSLGTDLGTNASGNTYVAYCFAEIPGFSKIFSYTGNGSADGPFVHCGFKPKFVLIKESSAAGNNWQLYDSVRDPSNQMTNMLFPNTSGAESTGFNMDFLSNGFKSRLAGTGVNTNGNTYVGIAFADVPAKYSLAR